MLKALGGSVVSYLVAIVAGALFVGGPAAYVSHNMGYGKAAKKHDRERVMWITRELALWHELGAARVSQIDLIDSLEVMWDVTGEAKRRMQQALASQREKARISSEAAAAAIKRLDYVESTWKDVRVPDVIVEPFCVPDGSAACDPATPEASLQDDLEVREPASGNGN